MISRLKHEIRGFIFEIKKDPKAREALRPLILGIALALSIFYLSDAMWIGAERKALTQLQGEVGRLTQRIQDAKIYGETLLELSRQRKILEEKVRRLEFKKHIWSLERAKASDRATFRRILLGFGPNSPQLKSFGLVKVSKGEEREREFMTVKGELTFHDLLQYLDYLQKRPEVAYLDGLKISEDFCGKDRKVEKRASRTGRICFELLAGRRAPTGKR